MRIGIIGSGFGLYGLLPAFNSTKGCKVVALCGRKTERLTNYCESIGLTHVYTDWEEMLDQEKLDAVAIAVPPDVQYKIAKQAIKKGLHIFAEKPLAANLAQAKELFLLSKQKKIITAVDFIFPEINEWQKLKSIIVSKKYGDLQHISVNWNFLSYHNKHKVVSWKSNTENGGGALAFYLSHTLYYLEFLAGKIKETQANFSYYDKKKGETGVDLLLNFNNGIQGNLQFSSTSVGVQTHRVVCICKNATIVLENNKNVIQDFSLTIHTKDKIIPVVSKKEEIKNNEDERVEIVKKIVKRFIKGCKEKTEITPSFKQGVEIQSLIEKIKNTTK